MLTFERANELFRYDPISGKVFRKVTTSSRSIKGAHIGVNGTEIHLGSFKTLEEAATARQNAEIKYGYHENHGL